MKPGIHPQYLTTAVTCACGATFETRSTKKQVKIEICSACHPFFTGQQKFIDAAGRVERFKKRFESTSGNTVVRKVAKAPIKKLVAATRAKKTLTSAPKTVEKISSPKAAPKK
jgi:large subunit ribosomal protein L31